MFLNGKMNKDLDERLIPKGEYRDALNIDVSYSEGADVGVLQNILSNEEVSGMNLVGGTCVGVVKDTEHDKIYWLVAGTNRNGIFEYDGTNIKAILLEEVSDNILQFDSSRYITGINILDKILYFTDNYSEPKQVDTEYWGDATRFGGVTDFESGTINTFNLSEDRITVAKKAPLNAPTFETIDQSLRGGAGTEGNSAVTFTKNFFTIEIDDTFSGNFSAAPNYQVNDIIEMKNSFLGEFGKDIESVLRVEITVYSGSGTSFTGKLLSKTSEIEDASVAYTCILEEENPIFELKFPKFSYRYKYLNGQYSVMSPFSLPAFIPGDFIYDGQEGYNLGMTNNVRELKLQGWFTSPSATNYQADIEEIEILYKDSVSPNIYIVEALKKSAGNFPATFQIKDEQIFKTIESNQLLRSYDSVPKKSKSQEIVANRIIYANIEENFNIPTNPSFTISTISRTSPDYNLDHNFSIKSGRTYQVGVVYQDEYGRQTPVFTDTTGIIKINSANADLNSAFRVSTSHVSLPSELTHYKYYIKEVSNPYYNICVSNIYEDTETGYIYCAFPSSETNKVSEEDILILKKQTGDSPYKIISNNKFKVLDKDSEPPKFLAEKTTVTYEASTVRFAHNFGSGGIATTKSSGLTPVPGHNTIQLERASRPGDTNTGECSVEFKAIAIPGAKIRFRRLGTNLLSNIYTIKSVEYDEFEQDEGELTFEEQFGEDVNVIYLSNANDSEYSCSIEFLKIEDDTGNPEFAGKFFVKLNNSTQLKQALIGDNDEANLNTLATTVKFDGTDDSGETRMYHWTHVSTTSSALSSGTYNNQALGSGFHLIIETEEHWADSRSNYETDPFNAGFEVGNYLRFSGYTSLDNNFDNISEYPNYKIIEIIQWDYNNRRYWAFKFNKLLEYNFPSATTEFEVDVRSFSIEGNNTPKNPPIFEIEPKEGVLDIYYETEKTYPIADLNNNKDLDYTNCISFGNGVESDRIRDDFNAPTIGKGVRVSTVFEDNYQEDNLKNRLIFSGIYNSKNGVNRLNQFIIAEPITKDLNPEYGSIQKLHARDTDLIALCEDRIVKILANKDALFNADGNPQLTATNRVLGQAIIPATFGAYGISKNPESFVDFTYRAYFTDKNRGKVLRLSMDGLTEISEYGMKDYFKDNLAAETGLILGTYDTNKGLYNLTFENEADTVSFSEGVRGWTSRKSFIPEAGVSLNNMYYTFKNGKLYKHYNSSDNRNTFYGTTTNPEVTLILNDSPANIKNFRTLNYKGDSGWTASSILTEKQDGAISSFINKEDIYYNYISGVTEDTNTLDTKAFNIQGLGGLTSTSISSGTRSFVFNFNLPDGISVPDNLYYVDSNDDKINLGTITNVDKENKTIDIGSYDTNITAPSADDYMFYVKDAKFNTSGILGYYAEITMTNTSTDKKELYSVGSEISLSS